MENKRDKLLDRILVYVLLGLETWYLLFYSLASGAKEGFLVSGYLFLLLVYPILERQKSNISKREAFLTIFLRWMLLNIGISFFLLDRKAELTLALLSASLLRLTILGGITIYGILFLERLCKKREGKLNCLFIYGRADERYLHMEPPIWHMFQTSKIMSYWIISSQCSSKRIERYIGESDKIYILDVSADRRNELLKLCYKAEKPVYCISKISDILLQGGCIVKYEDRPFFCCEKYRLDRSEECIKRIFDVLCSFCALVLLIPLFLCIAICIKLEDGGPVIYKQLRCTKDGKEFNIYKFRSMVVDAELDGVRLAEGKDKRITKVGAFLRNTKLDELPQLVNILQGDMSIVGPRPERPEFIREIVKEVPEFEFRTYVKAGLTGYAQVQGNYATSPLDKLKWDLMYIHQYSFVLDLKIIIMTPFIIFLRNNREN